MKFFDVVLLVLFMVGCFVGAVTAKTYLIPYVFQSAGRGPHTGLVCDVLASEIVLARTATETVAGVAHA